MEPAADCPFCRTADKVTVWEDSDLVAFLDNRPIREGHCQILPRQHVEMFEQLSPELAGRIIVLGQRIARHLKATYEVKRVAFLITGGDVPHVHAHVVPMHRKCDITSGRYFPNHESTRLGSVHLKADRDKLLRVREKLGTL